MKTLFTVLLLVSPFFPILSQQRVGIGTTSPNASALLDVQSTTQGMLVPRMTSAQRTMIASPANGLLVFDITTNSFWFRGSSAWTELVDGANDHVQENGSHLYLGMSGNVGIGTTTPPTKLTIQTAGSTNGLSHTNSVVTLATHTSNTTGSFGTTSNHPFHLMANNGSNHVTISTIGNLGLGTQTPVHPLSFAQITGPKINLFGDANSSFGIGIAPNLLQIHSNAPSANIGLGYQSAGSFIEKIRITGSGQMGIGTTSPVQTLHVAGNSYVRDSIGIGVPQPHAPLSFPSITGEKISLYGNSNANFGIGVSNNGELLLHSNQSNADIAFGYGSTSNFTERMRVTASGRLGIGTNTPTEMFSVGEKFRVTSAGSIKFNNDVANLIYLYDGSSAINKMIFSHSTSFPTFGMQYEGTTNKIKFRGNATAMTVDVGNQRVGIGTESPTQSLDVTGNVNVTGDLLVAGDVHAGYQVIEIEYFLLPFATEDIDCSCPPGKTVTGGGWDAIAGPTLLVSMSRPIQSSKWRIRASNSSAAPNPIRVFAICTRIKT